MQPGRKWRRTAVTLNGRFVPLRDDWSLYEAASELEIARIARMPDGDWRYVVRIIRENKLMDESMCWLKTNPEAKAYCESQTNW